MITFLQFLNEANAAGSKFEQKIADNVNSWLKASGLEHEFSAKRFQKIEEDEGNRDEDYSDVVIENLKTGDQFFIECKQNGDDNSITNMFDITKDFKLKPVENRNREEVDDSILLKLANDLEATDGFQKFVDFLQTSSEELNGKTPADYYFNVEEANDQTIGKLIRKYNQLVDDGKTEADCKKFDSGLIRESTRNMLAVALLWRLDPTNTWDICHLESISYFGDLMRKHYLQDKAIPAKYLQLGDIGLYSLDENSNPLKIDCCTFPNEVFGRFDLKFTPRFGVGAMYVTPRSKLTSELPESCSFSDEDRFPALV